MRVPARPASLDPVRDDLVRALAPLRGRLGEDGVAVAELLLVELLANALLHAGLAPGDTVSVEVRDTGTALRVEVGDPGRGFEPGPVSMPTPTATHGRGLALVDALSARWGAVRGDLMRVWFELPCTAEVPVAAAA
jgi:anti-sigma regulatory factor (Ser/Thr protein kinase)